MNGKKEEETPTIGIEGYIITSQYSEAYHMPVGFYISKIVADSAADKSKLEIGNIITEIDGKEVDELSDIQKVLNKKKSGDKITLKVYYISGREYKEKNIDVTL